MSEDDGWRGADYACTGVSIYATSLADSTPRSRGARVVCEYCKTIWHASDAQKKCTHCGAPRQVFG